MDSTDPNADDVDERRSTIELAISDMRDAALWVRPSYRTIADRLEAAADELESLLDRNNGRGVL